MKLQFIIPCLALISSLAAASTELSNEPQVINFLSLTENDLSHLTSSQDSPRVIEFSSGTLLPLKFFLKGDIVTLVEEVQEIGTLRVEKPFYLTYANQEFLFSLNLIHWKPFLEFFTGEASCTVQVNETGPSITVGADLNKRS